MIRSPRDQIAGTRKARHVHADLRHEDVGDDVTRSRIVVSSVARPWIGSKDFPTDVIHLRDPATTPHARPGISTVVRAAGGPFGEVHQQGLPTRIVD